MRTDTTKQSFSFDHKKYTERDSGEFKSCIKIATCKIPLTVLTACVPRSVLCKCSRLSGSRIQRSVISLIARRASGHSLDAPPPSLTIYVQHLSQPRSFKWQITKRFPAKILYVFFVSSIRATRPG